ncbi:flippase [Bifidobacterium pseudolongum subsp. globosum]|nr:flippase [Bifidobacterium pseudolongum subsp. globosum]
MILGGSNYLSGNDALRIGAPLVLLGSIGSMQSQYMVASNQEKTYTYTNVAGLVIASILECLFIPLWGIKGAALGLVLTELSVYCIRTYILRDFMKQVRQYTDYGKIVFAWAVAFLCAGGAYYLIGRWNPFVQLILIALVFCVSDGGMLMLTKESFFTSMLKRKR